MRLAVVLILSALMYPPALCRAEEKSEAMRNWPQWRGPLGTGVAPLADPPLNWSESENVRWKTELPGKGHSTPAVWGNRIVLTSAVPFGKALEPKPDTAPGAHDNAPVTHHYRFVVIAVDRRNGQVAWTRRVHEALPHEGGHFTGSLASSSPVTDGQSIFAYFGSRGLYCLDMDGDVRWRRDFGTMQTKHAHGEGSSPALYGDVLVVNWDHEGQSFITALDKRSGHPLWKVTRDEVTSWASPIIVEHGDAPQVVVSGTNRIRGYDLKTGRVVWECGGLSANVVATPVAGDGMVFAASSYDTRAILAIHYDRAEGDITGSDRVVWSRRERSPYIPSPLLYDGTLYFLAHYQGILSRVQAKTGAEPLGPFRLGRIRNVYASPLGAGGRVYVTDRDGTTMVIGHDGVPRLLAVNPLDDSFSASAVAVGRDLILRGQRNLYCLTQSD